MTYFKNVNTGRVLNEAEYKALLEREYAEMWIGLDDDDKVEWGTEEAFISYQFTNDADRDFVECDEHATLIVEG